MSRNHWIRIFGYNVIHIYHTRLVSHLGKECGRHQGGVLDDDKISFVLVRDLQFVKERMRRLSNAHGREQLRIVTKRGVVGHVHFASLHYSLCLRHQAGSSRDWRVEQKVQKQR